MTRKIKLVGVSVNCVTVTVAQAKKHISWRDLREAARSDLPDPNGIGEVYRALLAEARAEAGHREMSRWIVEIPGLYQSDLYPTFSAARYVRPELEATWRIRAERDYGLSPEQVGSALILSLDPDEVALRS